jgi:mannose-6-phosphate isomerase-like protein (cupin superfamily)
MKITKTLEIPEAENAHGVSHRMVFTSPHFSAVHVLLNPGQSTPRHPAPVDVFLYVLEGSGTIEIGDESAEIARDMALSSQAGAMHRIINTGSTPLRILVVRAPQSSTPPRYVGDI